MHLIKRSYEIGAYKTSKHTPVENEMMTKMGRDMMTRKKNENKKYAESMRQKEMFEWRNR